MGNNGRGLLGLRVLAVGLSLRSLGFSTTRVVGTEIARRGKGWRVRYRSALFDRAGDELRMVCGVQREEREGDDCGIGRLRSFCGGCLFGMVDKECEFLGCRSCCSSRGTRLGDDVEMGSSLSRGEEVGWDGMDGRGMWDQGVWGSDLRKRSTVGQIAGKGEWEYDQRWITCQFDILPPPLSDYPPNDDTEDPPPSIQIP